MEWQTTMLVNSFHSIWHLNLLNVVKSRLKECPIQQAKRMRVIVDVCLELLYLFTQWIVFKGITLHSWVYNYINESVPLYWKKFFSYVLFRPIYSVLPLILMRSQCVAENPGLKKIPQLQSALQYLLFFSSEW